ncbi:MAG: ribonucleotide reductase N-terminal alpha domain-containing protein, partial [Candidatus Thorarchaeota archaeon]
MVSYDEALKLSEEYFNDDLSAKVFVDKYALRDDKGEILEQTPADMHKRLSREFARIEKKYPNPLTEDQIFDMLDRFKYIVPQGSPMYSVGNKYQLQTVGNCFAAGTKVHTESGIKNIEDIQCGDRVVTHLGRMRSVVQTHKNSLAGR